MRLRATILLSTILMILSGLNFTILGKPYGVSHLDNTTGLSSNNVKSICQDHMGLIWIGTKNGLNRFDGVSIHPYIVYDNEAHRGNNNISSLYTAPDNSIWVGTDRGIYIFNPKNETFTLLTGESKEGVSPHDWVQSIGEDRDGNVWTLIPNQGVFRITPDHKVDFYSVIDHGGDHSRLPNLLLITEKGKVLAGTNADGIFIYDKESNRFHAVGGTRKEFEILKQNAIASLIDDKRGTIYVIQQNGDAYSLSLADEILAPFPLPLGRDVFVRAATMVDNELWIGTAHGLYVYDLPSKSIEFLDDNQPGAKRLPDNIIMALLPDADNNVWVGTMYGGVVHLRRHGLVFENFTRDNTHDLSSFRVRGMATDKDGRIWIGSTEKGINVLDPVNNTVIHPSGVNANSKECLVIRRSGDKMVAGYNRAGMDLFNGYNNTANFASNLLKNPTSVYSVLEDSKGNIWVAVDYGAFIKKADGADFVPVEGMESAWINKIFEDSKGMIWFASIGTGIWRYNPTDGKMRHYEFYEDHRNGLRTNSINSVMEDSSGQLWFSTERGGLAKYNVATDDFTSYGIEEGLPDDMVYEVLEDNRGFLWFGTARGLVKFNPTTGGVKVFDESNGLDVTQFNYASATKGLDGKFYMGGFNGIVAFNPMLDTSCDSLPPIYITSFRSGNEEMMVNTSSSPEPVNVLFADDIELQSNISNFSLSIATPTYNNNNTMVYSYRLLPKDKEWTVITDPSNLTFVGLAPGKYTLELRAQSDDAESIRRMGLKILPPWYQTIWAYLGIFLLLIGILVMAFIIYRKNQQKKIKEQEKLFSINKEKELYKSKMMFFTEIAHEIRTPLTLIGTPLEAIEEMDVDNPKVQKYIGVIRQNTNRLLDLTTQLLDFQKLGNERPELRYETVDITDLIKKIVERFEMTIASKNKQLIVDLPQKSITAHIDKEAITKIISNLLNNALKYSSSRIEVRLSEDNEMFRLEVVSDGNKISGDDVYHIFEPFYQIDKNGYNQGVGIGLPLTRTLASMHGGSIELENLEGPDNTFLLRIPLKQESVVTEKVETNPTMTEYVMDDQSLLTTPEAGYSLLFVDDNDEMREFLYDQLSKSFVVETAASGVEALEKLKDHKFDIIVTDIMMPEMDGYEFCRRVKEDSDLSHIPVVFLTAKNDLESKVKALKTGGEAYIEKPFSIKYFRQQVMSLLDNRRHERKAFLNKPFFSVDNMKLNKAEEEFMGKVIDIINRNIDDENFSVESMADALCMSRSSLLRKIKTLYNLSPVELIRLVRLKKAAELIQEGKYRISDVCFMVGINSSSYFSKLFYKQFGVTPKAFEKQCQNNTQIILTTSNPTSKTTEQSNKASDQADTSPDQQ